MAMEKEDARDMPPNPGNLAKTLKDYLVLLNWDYKQLAEEAGVNEKTVFGYTSGRRARMLIAHLNKLGDALARGMKDARLDDEHAEREGARDAKGVLYKVVSGEIPKELLANQTIIFEWEPDKKALIVGYEKATPEVKEALLRAVKAEEALRRDRPET